MGMIHGGMMILNQMRRKLGAGFVYILSLLFQRVDGEWG